MKVKKKYIGAKVAFQNAARKTVTVTFSATPTFAETVIYEDMALSGSAHYFEDLGGLVMQTAEPVLVVLQGDTKPSVLVGDDWTLETLKANAGKVKVYAPNLVAEEIEKLAELLKCDGNLKAVLDALSKFK